MSDQEPVRLFIAVPVTSEFIRTGRDAGDTEAVASEGTLAECLDELRGIGRPVRAVAENALHVTLKFLGDSDPELIPQIEEQMQQIASRESAFRWRVQGLGAFPHIGRPSVIWAGLQQAETCTRIAQGLEEALEPLGIAREKRPFHAHLTLARVKGRPPRGLTEWLRTQENVLFGSGNVTAIELIRSELRPEGPQYTTLAAVTRWLMPDGTRFLNPRRGGGNHN